MSYPKRITATATELYIAALWVHFGARVLVAELRGLRGFRREVARVRARAGV